MILKVIQIQLRELLLTILLFSLWHHNILFCPFFIRCLDYYTQVHIITLFPVAVGSDYTFLHVIIIRGRKITFYSPLFTSQFSQHLIFYPLVFVIWQFLSVMFGFIDIMHVYLLEFFHNIFYQGITYDRNCPQLPTLVIQ